MKSQHLRILVRLSGFLLMAVGLYCICRQDVTMLSFGVLLGMGMMFSGLIEMGTFYLCRKQYPGASWQMLGGFLTVAVSSALMLFRSMTLLALPFLFACWLFLTGMTRIFSAHELLTARVEGWGQVLVVGVMLSLAGVLLLFDPLGNALPLDISIGMAFVLEGISNILMGDICSRTVAHS